MTETSSPRYRGLMYDKTTGDLLGNFSRSAPLYEADIADPTIGIIQEQYVRSPSQFRLDLAAWQDGGGVFSLIEKGHATGLADAKSRALLRLTMEVNKARERYLSPGATQMQDYQEKLREAEAFALDPAPVASDYPMLSAEVGFHGTSTLADMASLVSTRAAETRAVLAAINMVKFSAINSIDAATSEEAVTSILENLTWPNP